MKKYLLMASCLLAGALVVSSCGDDNDDNTPGNTASAEVQAIVARMLASTANQARFLSAPTAASLAEALNECLPRRDVMFTGGPHPFNYLHKVIGGRDAYLFGNIDATPATDTVRVRTTAPRLTLLDPHTGATSAHPVRRLADGYLEFRLTLTPGQSVLLVDSRSIK